MKIGIDARLYRASVAGIGRYSQNLIKNILALDAENEYVLIMTAADATEFQSLKLPAPNVKVIETEIAHYSLAEQTKLSKIIEQEKFDLVHFLNFNYPINYKGKFIVTIHDLTLFFYPGRTKNNLIHKLAYKYIFKKACQNSAKIIAVSESTKNDIIQTFKTNPSKIQVIYEAADDKTFSHPSKEIITTIKDQYQIGDPSRLGRSEADIPVVLYVGQWRPHKNLVGLIKAFEILRKSVKAKLVIIGKIDPSFPEVMDAIDKSPNLRDIIKPGFVSEQELAAFYKLAHVFVFPSFYEGFGLPGLEAMMAETAVCASNRTSLPEIYRDAAIYFNPSDPQDIAQKIEQVLANDELRRGLIKKGKKVLSLYSWKKTAEETLGVYREILKIK